MHDWILLSLLFDWKDARITIDFRDSNSRTVSLIAKNVVNLMVPKRNEWGRSESVNGIAEPVQQKDGTTLMCIEMQSGDTIEIAAYTFVLPC